MVWIYCAVAGIGPALPGGRYPYRQQLTAALQRMPLPYPRMAWIYCNPRHQ